MLFFQTCYLERRQWNYAFDKCIHKLRGWHFVESQILFYVVYFEFKLYDILIYILDTSIRCAHTLYVLLFFVEHLIILSFSCSEHRDLKTSSLSDTRLLFWEIDKQIQTYCESDVIVNSHILMHNVCIRKKCLRQNVYL